MSNERFTCVGCHELIYQDSPLYPPEWTGWLCLACVEKFSKLWEQQGLVEVVNTNTEQLGMP